MKHDAVSGVLDSVRRIIGFDTSRTQGIALDTDVLNQPWRMARCHAAFHILMSLLHISELPSDPVKKREFYELLTQIMVEIYNTIRFMRLCGKGEDSLPNPAEVLMKTVLDITHVLLLTSGITDRIGENRDRLHTFYGPETIREFQNLNTLNGGYEMQLLRQAAALLDAASPVLRKAALSHKHQLDSSAVEHYEKSALLMEEHYRKLAAEFLPPEADSKA